jgi:hypothetical protein
MYCLWDEFLKASGVRAPAGTDMRTAAVMTPALVAADLFSGCFEQSRHFLQAQGSIPHMLSKSRCNRRRPAIPDCLWQGLLHVLSEAAKQTTARGENGVERCPVPLCANLRLRRCHLSHGEAYRGYMASKRRYFFGLRIPLLVPPTGQPIAFALAPGAAADHADAAYTDYPWADLLAQGPLSSSWSPGKATLCAQWLAPNAPSVILFASGQKPPSVRAPLGSHVPFAP